MEYRDPYAPPESAVSTTKTDGCRREGKFVIVPIGEDLPPRCILCNAPAQTPVKSKKVSWHSVWWVLLILVNILLYIIVALIVRKRAEVSPGFCAEHIAQRKKRGAISLLVALACFVGSGLLFFVQSSALAGLPLIPAFCAMIYAAVATGTVHATEISKTYIKLKGCKEPFLASIGE